jgi:hypothetical protein
MDPNNVESAAEARDLEAAAQVLGAKPSVASAGSDLDFDNAFATVVQQTGPAIGASVITDQSSCDFLAREPSALKICRRVVR